MLTGRNRGPAESGRPWLASRLASSLGGIAKALAALAAEHHSDDMLTPDVPALMVSTVRGKGRTAAREILPGVPFVDLPEWTLGDDVDGPLVSHLAWRLYAILIHKRAPRRATVTLGRADVAQLLRVRADSLPALYRELAAAEMLIVVDRPGRTTMLLPLLRRTTQAERDAAHARLTACGDPVDKPITPLASDDAPHPPTGPSPRSSTGTAPDPYAGPSSKRPDLGRGDLKDPRVAAPAPFGAGGPADGVDVVAQRAAGVAAATAGARDEIAAARARIAAVRAANAEAAAARPARGLDALRAATGAAAWCGACEHSSRRVILDDGALGAACPTCTDHEGASAA